MSVNLNINNQDFDGDTPGGILLVLMSGLAAIAIPVALIAGVVLCALNGVQGWGIALFILLILYLI